MNSWPHIKVDRLKLTSKLHYMRKNKSYLTEIVGEAIIIIDHNYGTADLLVRNRRPGVRLRDRNWSFCRNLIFYLDPKTKFCIEKSKSNEDFHIKIPTKTSEQAFKKKKKKSEKIREEKDGVERKAGRGLWRVLEEKKVLGRWSEAWEGTMVAIGFSSDRESERREDWEPEREAKRKRYYSCLLKSET